ncbi:hypothetical protein C7B82_25090 [Stenomitos frigidus ULC18]|uniref:Outer membrane protein beta-barrel domain-containing protein n=2 Tax=Stenomitos TaxID=1844270 RepID=A0A2T1DX03_9CYAN|nr:hypothetical protein C7B82_25090 [Stenomitos frigidus ULC18]
MLLGGAALAASIMLTPSSATAQAAYGSYVGAGIAVGLTDGDAGGEPQRTSGVIAARYKFLKLPVSIRTQALIGKRTTLVPTISYDLPINWRTDAYLGVGAAVPLDDDRTTPLGNKTSFAIQPGIDYVLPNSQAVIFGNAVIAFDAYRKGGNTAASIQAGVGLRF